MTADFPPCVTPELLAAVHANDRRNPMPDDTDPLDVLQVALDAATPGPWSIGLRYPNEVWSRVGQADVGSVARTYAENGPADAAAIVALRNAAPELLAAIRNVRALAEEMGADTAASYGLGVAAQRLRAALGSFGGQQ